MTNYNVNDCDNSKSGSKSFDNSDGSDGCCCGEDEVYEVVETITKVMEVGVLETMKAMVRMMAMTMRMVMPRVVMIIVVVVMKRWGE